MLVKNGDSTQLKERHNISSHSQHFEVMVSLTLAMGCIVLSADFLIKTGVLGTPGHSSSCVHLCLLLLQTMLISIESSQ